MGRNRSRKLDRRAHTREAAVLVAPGRVQAGDAESQAWYVAEGQHGQQLLDQGHVGPATEIFQTILTRLGEGASYGRAVILGRLARCFCLGGQPGLAEAPLREAMDVTGRLPPTDGVKALRGTLRSELGDVFRALGRYGDARKSYEAALRIAEELQDLRGQSVDLGQLGSLALVEGRVEEAEMRYRAGLQLIQQLREPGLEAVAWHQLGRVFQAAQQWDEAERHYREAARISEDHRDGFGAAQSWSQLALLSQEAGRWESAEGWYRKAIEADRQSGNRSGLARHLGYLAHVLQNDPQRLAEARQLVEEALAIGQSLDPTAAEVWKSYGILADIAEKQAGRIGDGPEQAALQAQARDYRQIGRYAPLFIATLARLVEGPSYGRAVLLGRLGRCFQLGGRPELAVAALRRALDVTGELPPGDGLKGLQGALSVELGDSLGALGRYGDAREAYQSSLRSAHELLDLRGQGWAVSKLAAVASAEGNLEEAEQWRRKSMEADAMSARATWSDAEATGGVTLYEDVTTEYAFDTDLLVDGTAERRMSRWAGEPDLVPDDVRPMLVPGVRAWMDEEGSVRFRLPPAEPAVERDPGCTIMRRTRREVVVSGHSGVLWHLIEQIDGASSVAEIVARLPAGEREAARRLLGVLAATGAVDRSGRPVSRFIHSATKKGVLPAGGLGNDEVLRLATDGEYRAYPEAPRISLGQAIPSRLRPFHTLTRSRRSQRDYLGQALSREDFDALLVTACGITGSMPWEQRDLKLRAYPSSGALYAVEVYPIVLRVESLEPAVYHYRAVENVLEVVRPGIDPARLVRAALPVEREMLAGVAAMICLVGSFPRHERKYGQGGYRMLVAEAGHISQNLVLSATALGLSARPFGGVFDDLLNRDLGLDGEDEQFLLGVLVGHAGGSAP